VVPREPAGTDVACIDLVTSEQVGEGLYEQYAIAEKLNKGEFQRYESQGYILCHYAGAEKGQGSVLPTIDIGYLFDAATRELVLTHIEWKNYGGGPRSGSCVPAPKCADYVTPGRIGTGLFERYGIAEKLRNGEFTSLCSRGVFHCIATREVGGVEVLGDELLFEIDMTGRELSMLRIHWREDLSEPIPPAQISREEAEAIVGGLVQGGSHLHLISPDAFVTLGDWGGRDLGPGDIQTNKSIYRHPCWFIFSGKGAKQETTCTTVVDAVTGDVIRQGCGSVPLE